MPGSFCTTAGGDKATDPCTICPAGTFSPGGNVHGCTPCGFGFSSKEGSSDQSDCVAIDICPMGAVLQEGVEQPYSLKDCVCKPGHGAEAGSDNCRPCPAGTFSPGGSMQVCVSCGFGHTSEEGADSCRPLPQSCPVGQWAPYDAVSEKECQCYKGFGGERWMIEWRFPLLSPA